VLEATGIDVTDELVRDVTRLEREVLDRGIHVWDDGLPTIAALRGRGIGVAIVSNCDHNTRPIVEATGLVDAVDATILSFEVGVAKPDAGIYLAALDALGGIAPADALFVDDQAPYCDGATAVGLRTALILREDASPPEGLSETGDHTVILDLEAVLDLV
jgi:HAD superfamily hydrolase (TIGR01509 family)